MPLPVVVEHGCDARHVSPRRVARDEALDELSRDERSDIRVIEDIIERGLEVLLRGLTLGQDRLCDTRVAQQFLRARRVLLRIRLHRLNLGRVRAPGLREERSARVVPTGEDVGKALDHGLVVGGKRIAGRVHRHAPVRVQLYQPDREQLHELAGVILVGADVARRVGLPVAEHVEERAHRRVQGHVFHQLAEVTERSAGEQVVIIRGRKRHLEQFAVLRHNHDLRKREGNALAQLIGRAHRMLEPDVLARVVEHPGTLRDGVFGLHGGQLQRWPDCHLLVDPLRVGLARVAECDQPIDLRAGRTERRLVQETKCLGACRWCCVRVVRCEPAEDQNGNQGRARSSSDHHPARLPSEHSSFFRWRQFHPPCLNIDPTARHRQDRIRRH